MNISVSMEVGDLLTVLNREEQNVIMALEKAHSKAASEGEKMLKRGLSWRAGRDSSDAGYENSPKGSLPYMHSGRLRRSIGYKVRVSGKKVTSEVGSGARGTPIEYAQYLQGEHNDGIRPFLDYVEGVYNPQTIEAYFEQFYKPLAGGK